jgi:hypothetical protein
MTSHNPVCDFGKRLVGPLDGARCAEITANLGLAGYDWTVPPVQILKQISVNEPRAALKRPNGSAVR